MLIRSYRLAFILLFMLFLAITVIGVASNAYRRATEASLELSGDVLTELSEKIVNRAGTIFTTAWSDLAMNTLVVGQHDIIEQYPALAELFGLQLALMPQLHAIHVSDTQGNLVMVRDEPQLLSRLIDRRGPVSKEATIYRAADFTPIAHVEGNADYDPRQRGWFIGAQRAAGQPYWSEIYRFIDTKKLGVTLAQAVTAASGYPTHIFGVDITLESLSTFLAEQGAVRDGYALIIDSRDRLAAYPHQLPLKRALHDEPMLPHIDDLVDSWLVEAYRRYQQLLDGPNCTALQPGKQPQFIVSETAGKRYLARCQPLITGPGHGEWVLFIAIPEAALLSNTDRLLSESAVISLIVLIIAVVSASYLSVKLFEPLRELVRNTELIKDFRMHEVKRVKSRFREIEAMDDAIWGMKQGLQALEKFVPADVARHLIQSRTEVEPGGETYQLTFLLTGIARFGALCARLPAEELAALLTDDLDRFTGTILRQKGTIDNYLGESILAFWGAPIPCHDGPQRACRAALTCLRQEGDRNQRWQQTGMEPPRNLFSIHTGTAIVGNIGSRQRLSYTAIGDNVTLSWDLRRLNHRFGTRIILSGAVREQISDAFWVRRLDRLHFNDGRPPLELFELIDSRETVLPTKRLDFIHDYESALEALLDGAWEQAQQQIAELERYWPEDRSVQLLKIRCQLRNPCYCPIDDPLSAGLLPSGIPSTAISEQTHVTA